MKRQLILCCDDAGWDQANDEVIAKLAQQQRVSAVSLLSSGVNTAAWRDYPIVADYCSLGLHLNLTWQAGQPSQGLAKLIIKAYSRQLSKTELAESIVRQLQQFEQQLGQPPEFVDGHQHIHMLPTIRSVLLEQLQQRYGKQLPAIRAPYSRVWRGKKAFILNSLGAKQLYHRLIKQRWCCNHDFAGVYDFSTEISYAQRMQTWLQQVENQALIMAHPGALNEVEHAPARVAEADFFFSNLWLQQLAQQQIELVPFRRQSLASY